MAKHNTGEGWERLRGKLAPWCERHGARLVVLFGSAATSRAQPDSDFDLAVWPGESEGPPGPEERLCWIGEIQGLLDRAVSLVLVSPTLDPVLGFQIMRQGRVLYESEPNLWAWERLRLWQLYCDTAPLRRLERESLRTYAEEVRGHGS